MLDCTDWTHEDMVVLFARLNRVQDQAHALRVVSHAICCITLDGKHDAVRMAIWRGDRAPKNGWGRPSRSATTDLMVLSSRG